jgi:[ribosomal protein S18]-alanine N-acetyltransferase
MVDLPPLAFFQSRSTFKKVLFDKDRMDTHMQPDLPLEPAQMQPSDLEDVLAIERTSFASPWSRDMFYEEMKNRNARVVVFRLEGKIVGYICFWVVLDEAHLMNIAVHPEQRGRGYGKAIMAYLESVCRQEGLNRLLLEVGRRNAPARSLYKKFGFSSIGFRKHYYAVIKDDALVMEKWLGSGEKANGDSEKSETK